MEGRLDTSRQNLGIIGISNKEVHMGHMEVHETFRGPWRDGEHELEVMYDVDVSMVPMYPIYQGVPWPVPRIPHVE